MVAAEDLIYKLLKKIALELRYDKHNAILQKDTNTVGNLTTLLYRVTLTSKNKPDMKLFTKVVVFSQHLREKVFGNIFERELLFYTQLARTFDRIQDQHNVRGKDRFLVPKFYGCNPNYLEETFVFEDISVHGFKHLSKLEVMDWEYAAKVVEELAKFHSLSIAYGQENPEIFKKFQMFPFSEDNFLGLITKRGVDLAADVVNREHKEKLFLFLKEAPSKPRATVHCPAVNHGDLKINNIMHRRRSDGGLEIQLLDFQLLRTDSVVKDLMFLIFVNTDQKFRKKYYHHLLNHYYENLEKRLYKIGVDCGKVYPRRYFDEETKTMMPFGLIMAVQILPLLLFQDSEFPELHENIEVETLIRKQCPEYATRLNEVVDEFVEWGIL